MIKPGSTIGIIGNGQLGRMSAIEAKKMGYTVLVYGPGKNSPAGQVADQEFDGDYTDLDMMLDFAKRCQVITFEFENISAGSLKKIQSVCPIHPDPTVIEITQHRLLEKKWLIDNHFPTTPFKKIGQSEDITSTLAQWKTKAVLKTTMFGYDGKGQVKLNDQSEAESAWKLLQTQEAVLEKWVDFSHELSVIVARSQSGEIKTFPIFENEHRNHILDVTYFPGRFSEAIQEKARWLGSQVAEKINLIGLLTIEMFLTTSGDLLINELAPRPHNSGHITFDLCMTSQFQQHIRAICDLPLGETVPLSSGIMINILGDSWKNGEPEWQNLLAVENLNLHLYGKTDPKPGRKMGHISLSGLLDENKLSHIRKILNH